MTRAISIARSDLQICRSNCCCYWTLHIYICSKRFQEVTHTCKLSSDIGVRVRMTWRPCGCACTHRYCTYTCIHDCKSHSSTVRTVHCKINVLRVGEVRFTVGVHRSRPCGAATHWDICTYREKLLACSLHPWSREEARTYVGLVKYSSMSCR